MMRKIWFVGVVLVALALATYAVIELTLREEGYVTTHAVVTDIDGDGLTYIQEKRYGTDPKDIDSDDDGLNDGYEVQSLGTDPLNPDTDGDLLSDGEEVKEYMTNPLNEDTDGDGLSDEDEVEAGTDPTDPDTDGDGLSDYEEEIYDTDPRLKDTDGDGLNDYEEVKIYGTDPLDPVRWIWS